MILIFGAPSGSGKSTLVNYLLQKRDDLEFSISATTRTPRGQEVNGKEYYFISNQAFEDLIRENKLVEWQQVYSGTYYGTLRSEIERIEAKHHHVVFDVDVKGGANLKRLFGDKALSIFVAPPSVEELRRRLVGRATDSPEKIEERLAKAAEELTYKSQFDVVIVNDDLQKAEQKLDEVVGDFLQKAGTNI